MFKLSKLDNGFQVKKYTTVGPCGFLAVVATKDCLDAAGAARVLMDAGVELFSLAAALQRLNSGAAARATFGRDGKLFYLDGAA